jgi:hypothetical protein
MDITEVSEIVECTAERCNAYLREGWKLIGLFQKSEHDQTGLVSKPVYVVGWLGAASPGTPEPAFKTAAELRKDARM